MCCTHFPVVNNEGCVKRKLEKSKTAPLVKLRKELAREQLVIVTIVLVKVDLYNGISRLLYQCQDGNQI
jgi:hypothetical protein